MTPTTLSKAERLLLLNQYAILQKLDPDQATHYRNCQEIVQRGYSLLYSDLGHIDAELPENVYQEVADILDMFRLLRQFYDNLDDKQGLQRQDLEFVGFDGNGSEGHYGLACFMIEDLGRWPEFKISELNSHGDVLPRYRGMLARFEQCPDKLSLTKEDLLQIVG